MGIPPKADKPGKPLDIQWERGTLSHWHGHDIPRLQGITVKIVISNFLCQCHSDFSASDFCVSDSSASDSSKIVKLYFDVDHFSIPHPEPAFFCFTFCCLISNTWHHLAQFFYLFHGTYLSLPNFFCVAFLVRNGLNIYFCVILLLLLLQDFCVPLAVVEKLC